MLSRFLPEMDEEYMIPAWHDATVESVRTLRQEHASGDFLDILGQLRHLRFSITVGGLFSFAE
jgi:hypothetical protein